MFDYIDRKRDPFAIAFYCGAAPFGLLWVLHHAVWTAFLLQAYLITMLVFVLDPFEARPKRARQQGFWTIMLLSGVIVHPTLLFGLWYIDSAYPNLVEGWVALFTVAFVIAVIELVVLGEIVDRLRPSEPEEEGVPPNV